MASKYEAISLYDSTNPIFSEFATASRKGLKSVAHTENECTVVSGNPDSKGRLRLLSYDEKAGTAPIFFDTIDSPETTSRAYVIEYSEPYLKIKIAQFIATAKPLLDEWASNVRTPEELKPIKNILKLIENSARYFDVKPDSRLLLGSIQNFIIKWGKLEEKQIKHFSTLLDWFNEGEIEKDKIKSFSQQVFLIIDNETDNDEETN